MLMTLGGYLVCEVSYPKMTPPVYSAFFAAILKLFIHLLRGQVVDVVAQVTEHSRFCLRFHAALAAPWRPGDRADHAEARE